MNWEDQSVLVTGGNGFIGTNLVKRLVELRVPKIRVLDNMEREQIYRLKSIDNKIPLKEIGLRPGEKLHEALISRDSSHHTIEFKDYYTIKPEFNFEKNKNFELDENNRKGKLLKKNFEYNSLNNSKYLSINELIKKYNL